MVKDGVRCPLCSGHNLSTVLERDSVPVFQNALYRAESDARNAQRGHIHLAFCDDCYFAFNEGFDSQKVSYDSNYENDQTHSQAFQDHVNLMADRVAAAIPDNGTLVEIGCGQGGFLEELSNRTHGRKVGLCGFDPSYRACSVQSDIVVKASLFNEVTATNLGIVPHVLVSRHVIEHVPDPVGFLRSIRRTANESSAQLFLETPCFEWIAVNRVFQDVFYEHVNYFTAKALSQALRRAGFATATVRHVFGGQYLWAEASTHTKEPSVVAEAAASDVAAAAKSFSKSIEERIGHWVKFLEDEQPTALWGAGAKGVTFAQLVDPARKRIDCVVDSNPRKQGAYVSITGHPIVAAEEAQQCGIKRILVMNPNYIDEIHAQVSRQNWDVSIFDAGVTRS